jgi:hypothetical protein
MKFINERIYWHGTGKISGCLNTILQDVLGLYIYIYIYISSGNYFSSYFGVD